MKSQTIKLLSQVAFVAGMLSVLGSAMIFLRGQKDFADRRRQTGLFVGLWAPSLFALSEMLDRVSIDDDSYMGVDIKPSATSRMGVLSTR